jgi:hypothetical protein
MNDAVLLLRSENMLRIALQGSDDVLELHWIAGMWVTEDCEPVHVDFAWSRLRPAEPVTEADCICSQELAARLIHLLYTGNEETSITAPIGRSVEMPAAYSGMVS